MNGWFVSLVANHSWDKCEEGHSCVAKNSTIIQSLTDVPRFRSSCYWFLKDLCTYNNIYVFIHRECLVCAEF